MKFNKLGLILTTLTISTIGFASSGSSALAVSFFGEDLQSFGSPNTNQQATDVPDLSVLKNSYTAEQKFLNALGGTSFGTINFESSEGFTELNNQSNPFNYNYDLKKADGNTVTMAISDPNSNSESSLNTTIQKTNGNSYDKNTNFAGGRYGISSAGLTQEQRLSNQFLNTNAGSDSNLEFSFSEAVSCYAAKLNKPHYLYFLSCGPI